MSRRAATLAFALLLLAACGNDAASSPGGVAGAGGASGAADAGGGAGTSCTATGESIDINGTFAIEAIVKAKVVIDLAGRQYFLARYTQSGTNVSAQTRLCELDLPSVKGLAEISVPPALHDVLVAQIIDMPPGEYLDATTRCAFFMPPAQLAIVGATLANPTTDALPTTADPSTAIDQDNDGNPGVTLDANVSVCSTNPQHLYVALRTGGTFLGFVLDSSHISGSVDARIDESVLGMSDACLSSAGTLKIAVQPGSTFRAVRVDGLHGSTNLDSNADGEIDCAELAAGKSALFGG